MGRAAEAAAASAPAHLLVLVNGLWGWQRDWVNMKRALDAANDGSCLVHVSAVNVGPQTYAGIDVCGTRLAREVQQLVSHTPSLTHISFIGHSMGGLIARYAIGLLTSPQHPSSSGSSRNSSGSGTVAGLQAGCFVSIASPHLGCSSPHPEEVHWQDRPYMGWLAAALSAGHLGGHEHMAPQHTAAAASAAAAAAQPAGMRNGSDSSSGSSGCGNNGRGSSSERSGIPTNTSSGSSKGWGGWGPGVLRCRSVVQLLGFDGWQPPADTLQLQDPHNTPSSSSSGRGDIKSCSTNKNGVQRPATAQAAGTCSSDCIVQLADAAGDVNESGCRAAVHQGNAGKAVAGRHQPCSRCCCSCACQQPQLRFSLLPAAGSSSPFSNSSSRSDNNTSPGGSSSRQHSSDTVAKEGSTGAAGGTGGPETVQLLDVLCRDVLVVCQGCGAQQQVAFLSGLGAFKHRLTYSSAGGDHLIPWSSSALLTPAQLPQRATQQAAAAAAAAVVTDSSQALQLPVLGLWATKPVIVEQQQQQHQQQQRTPGAKASMQGDSSSTRTDGNNSSSSSADAGPTSRLQAAAAAVGQDPPAGPSSSSSGSDGVLAARLVLLQDMHWRRMHVVWPRLCLGSSHCNIQYNGPLNFVGRAAVAHVCEQLMHTACE